MKRVKSIKEIDGKIEYLKCDNVLAATLVKNNGTHVYISKREFELQSSNYSFTACTGTLRSMFDEKGNKSQIETYAINWQRLIDADNKLPNSTKLGKGSMQISKIRRTGKFCKHTKLEKIFKEDYLTAKGVKLLATGQVSREEVQEKYGKKRYIYRVKANV